MDLKHLKEKEGDFEQYTEFMTYCNSRFTKINPKEFEKIVKYLKIKEWFSRNEYEFVFECEEDILFRIILSKIDDSLQFFGGRTFVQNGSHIIQQVNYEEVEKHKEFYEKVYLNLYKLRIKYQKRYELGQEIIVDEFKSDMEYIIENSKKVFELEEEIITVLFNNCVENKEKRSKNEIQSSMYH